MVTQAKNMNLKFNITLRGQSRFFYKTYFKRNYLIFFRIHNPYLWGNASDAAEKSHSFWTRTKVKELSSSLSLISLI